MNDCPAMKRYGRHDMRIDPSQVIGGGPEPEIRIACAECPLEQLAQTTRRFAPNPKDKRTWRPYVA